jgi:hypothetical protein
MKINANHPPRALITKLTDGQMVIEDILGATPTITYFEQTVWSFASDSAS